MHIESQVTFYPSFQFFKKCHLVGHFISDMKSVLIFCPSVLNVYFFPLAIFNVFSLFLAFNNLNVMYLNVFFLCFYSESCIVVLGSKSLYFSLNFETFWPLFHNFYFYVSKFTDLFQCNMLLISFSKFLFQSMYFSAPKIPFDSLLYLQFLLFVFSLKSFSICRVSL